MHRVLRATYRDGSLVLDEKLDDALEGKRLTLILMEDAVTSARGEVVSEEEQKQRFWEQIQPHSLQLPPNYRFDRENIREP